MYAFDKKKDKAQIKKSAKKKISSVCSIIIYGMSEKMFEKNYKVKIDSLVKNVIIYRVANQE